MCLVPLSTMATLNDPTEQDEKNIHQFLDYMATNPNALVIFHASEIILRTDTNASYITEPELCSCAAIFFLRGDSFKMYTRVFEWPHTRKFQYFEIC